MTIKFQENSTSNPNPLSTTPTESEIFQKTSQNLPPRNLPPGFMDMNSPLSGTEKPEVKEEKYIQFPKPTLTWSQSEPNAFHKELFWEAEQECLRIHENLTFWKEDVSDIDEEPIYPPIEAEDIIENSPELNKEQRAAILASTDDLILHALAGTGKTRSLSSMIAYLVAIGVKPKKIGVSSHTVTAAQEIKGRVEPMIETLFPRINLNRGEGIHNWIQAGTIHALAYRETGRIRHPKAKYAIIEENNQTKIWKEACQFSMGPDYNPEEDNLLNEWMRLHERIRGMAIPDTRVPDILKSITRSEKLSKIAETYRKIKEARDLLDYTDLLRTWIPVLLHPGYKNRWKYFFVDEYQDTSPIQKFILKILRHQGVKIIVCGDIRQSITSFTGSDPSIGDPLETLPGPKAAKELWLQVNYRCSQEIIALANAVLRQMLPPETHRLVAWKGSQQGTPPKITQIGDKTQEFRTTISEGLNIIELLKKDEENLKNSKDAKVKEPSVALLYRTNAQGSKLEETIAEMNTRIIKLGMEPITYTRKDYRRTALRNRTERELGAILHAWTNPLKARWFEILTSPYFKGIGEVTANTITTKATRKKPKEISDVWEIFEGEIPKKCIETVGNFLTVWERCVNETQEKPLENIPTRLAIDALRLWIKTTLESNNSKTASDALSKKEIEESQRRSYEASYLEKAARYGETPLKEALQKMEDDAKKEEEGNEGHDSPKGLILSTIHLAKGKEFDGVVLHNVSWYSLPHYNAINQEEFAEGITERRWRKLCSLDKETTKEEEGLIENILKNPENALPNIASYPKEALWGKSEREWERDGEPTPTKTPNHSTAWDWMTNPIEEEKRLLYVGITRARQRLVITTRSEKSHPFIPAKTWWKLCEGSNISCEKDIETVETSHPDDPF